jgi:phage tail sheath protein FI
MKIYLSIFCLIFGLLNIHLQGQQLTRKKVKRPGTYITSPQQNIPAIAQVETAIPVFIGYSQKAIYQKMDATNQIINIGSLGEYEQIFGGNTRGSYLWESIKLFYENGGGKCVIISVGSSAQPINRSALEKGLDLSRKAKVQMVVIPDAVGLRASDFYQIQKKMLSVCGSMKDRFAILNTLKPFSNVSKDITGFRVNTSGSNLSFGAAYYPWLITSAGQTVPPVGAIAGVFAKTDRSRGVWKAPANVSLQGVSSLTNNLNSAERDYLNVSPSDGKSVNSIATFSGKGIVVWGARTLAGNDNEWRYVPVRRFSMMVEQSIQKGTQWAVFEPNNANLWTKVEAQVSNFLTELWRDGALVGSKPEQAFFVKCGLNETMTNQDIINKKMIVEIGMAMVRPAEFTVIRIEKRMK